jgi:beta-hydroxylase
MYLFSAVPSKPLLGEREFPDLAPLSANWQMMREEALKLRDEGYIRTALHNNDIGFNSFFKRGWKRFYLKWYDQPLASAQALCPKTVELLNGIPAVKGAMFALLDPHSHLNPHRDPFAGSMRYHLGLVTPNSDACFISVDGERYFWKDGEAVLFDETYIHFVENNTDETRIILLCDIERPLRVRFMQAVNAWVSRKMVVASATQNVENEPVGALNRFYGRVYHPVSQKVSRAASNLKRRNRPLYRTLQYGLVLGLAYFVLA